MNSILLIDDSKEIFALVSRALEPAAELSWAQDLVSARAILKDQIFDLILLDINLPDGDGVEFCTEIMTSLNQTPIFFLTGNTALSDKVLGFSAGADDYITKPFAALELQARVQSKLKKQEILSRSADVLKWNEIKINKSRQEVYVFDSGLSTKIELTAIEFKLLLFFANRPYEVIPRDEILDTLWGKDVYVYSRSVDTHVSKLRKKLGVVSHLIESVHGSGYKFSPLRNDDSMIRNNR